MADLKHMQASATRQIRSWGQNAKAKVYRAGVVRAQAYAVISDWAPAIRSLRQDGATRILVAAPITSGDLDHQLDELEFAGVRYRIVSPVQGQKPDGVTRIKFDCECLEGASD